MWIFKLRRKDHDGRWQNKTRLPERKWRALFKKKFRLTKQQRIQSIIIQPLEIDHACKTVSGPPPGPGRRRKGGGKKHNLRPFYWNVVDLLRGHHHVEAAAPSGSSGSIQSSHQAAVYSFIDEFDQNLHLIPSPPQMWTNSPITILELYLCL